MKKIEISKVYIAGPMTGHENLNRDAFEQAAEELNMMGYSEDDIVNPASFPFTEAGDYSVIINLCLGALRECDAIYMLSGWEKSTGACIEYGYARAKGMRIMYQ